MTDVNKALDLAELGLYVFPVNHTEANEKKPYTSNGHLDATLDPGVIQEWWGQWPNAKPGVATGQSGIVVADIDTKNGKDGWESLQDAWVDIPTTFSYETGTGGSHLVYAAPEGASLNGQANYRGYEGVDRRGGSSWVLWVGETPFSREEFAPAPEWLVDEAKTRAVQGFSGTIQDWFSTLTSGEPNALVRKALTRINPDMAHSDMVAASYEAIRLGAEGCSGVPQLIDALEEAWMSRPAENHTTPEESWEYKFQEALLGGLEKYGESIDLLKNLPEYNIGLVPAEIPDGLVTTSSGKAGFSRLLGELVKASTDDNRILSILWNSPATKSLSRDWGLQFTMKRIQDARIKPEPIRENPRIEEKREAEQQQIDTSTTLLTDAEREFLRTRPTFADEVERVAQSLGYEQLAYFRAIGWSIPSMVYGMKGYVPVSDTQLHGLCLWNIIMGYSGTGKSVTRFFRDKVLDGIFEGDNGDKVGYNLGTDSSPQGLHVALLERDGKSSLFSADEASGFFRTLGKRDWDSGLEDTLSDWYMGRVSPSNKINLKELKGKSARTSFNMQMFATPDRLAETLTRDQFKSGFLARVMWSFGDPKKDTDEMFDIFKDSADNVADVEELPAVFRDLIADLVSSIAWIDKPLVLKPTDEAKARMQEAYKKMYRSAEKRANWDIVEPAVTRHMEAMLKCAGIAAMYREDTKIELVDALHAIKMVEEWYTNLFRVAELISDGQFQRRAKEIEVWVSERGGSASRAQIFNRFKNFIEKDSRELDSLLTYLVESGLLNRNETNSSIKYEMNGSV